MIIIATSLWGGGGGKCCKTFAKRFHFARLAKAKILRVKFAALHHRSPRWQRLEGLNLLLFLVWQVSTLYLLSLRTLHRL